MFGAIASIAGPVIGAAISSGAAGDASRAQEQSTAASIGEQRREYNLSRADSLPYRTAGSAAVIRLSDLLGLSPRPQAFTGTPRSANDIQAEMSSLMQQRDANKDVNGMSDPVFDNRIRDLQGEMDAANGGPSSYGSLTNKFTTADLNADPVYNSGLQFGLDEGTKGINRMAGARGNLNSGSTLKALTRYGNDYGSTKAAESYGRFKADQDTVYNRLAGVSGTGQISTANTAAMGASTAANIGNTLTAGGNARGAAAIAGGNAYGGAFNTIGNYYGQQQTLDKLLNKGGINGGGTATPMFAYTGYDSAGGASYG